MPPELDGLLTSFALAFLLILCRTGAAIMLLPGFGEDDVPALPRIGVAVAITLLLTPPQAAAMPPMPTDSWHLAGMVGAELLAGGLLGWLARLLALALPVAGQIISLMTGHSSVLQPDVTLGAQSAVIGKLFNLLAPVLILSTGLYALPLSAIAGSYRVLPAGTLLPSGDLAEVAVRATATLTALALQLSAPFLLIGTLWQVGLGLLSRLAPHIQLHMVSLPGQVLGGLFLLATLATALTRAWLDAMHAGFSGLPGA